MKKYKKFFLIKILCVGLLASTHIFSQAANNAKSTFFRVTVTDLKGRYITELEKKDFKVFEDGAEQEIDSLELDSSPASVLILVDVSESVTDITRKLSARYALQFVQSGDSLNEYSVVAFGKEIVELSDWESDEKKTEDALTKIFNLKRSQGNTIFNDALMLSQEKFKKAKNGKKIMLIFSDGVDNSSKNSFEKVTRELKSNDITIYSITKFTDLLMSDSINGQIQLEKLSEISGGKSFFPLTESELAEIITRLSAEIKSRYLLSYAPKENRKKKEWQDVEIKVSSPGMKRSPKLSARTRQGYFKSKE